MRARSLLVLLAGFFPWVCFAEPYAWQKAYSEVLPQGDLRWTPEPFAFEAGGTVRYIDFEAGDDSHSGESKDQPWKHHPWDPAAGGTAKSFGAATPATYVFKRGVIYRGRLVFPEDASGTAENPVRLTSDPSWGSGDAVLSGTERVTGWTRGAHPSMPEGTKVWKAPVDFLPRTLWVTAPDGTLQRLKLARHPNWTESDPNDLLAEWPVWENPEWWKEGKMVTQVNGKKRHKGVDRKLLTRKAEDYLDATVWSEWGIVMGSPYPARVEAFDEKEKFVAFRGPWTWEMSEKIITGNRYHLEDKAWMLDEPGEFWVERDGKKQSGTLYLRLPGDADPNRAVIEAGRRMNMMEIQTLPPTVVSGLTFRGTNVHWDYNIPGWAHPDLKNAAIRLNGTSGSRLTIQNCVFEHVSMALRGTIASPSQSVEAIAFLDNQVRDTDHGAVTLDNNFGKAGDPAPGPLGGRFVHVDVLRNKFERIGMRIVSGEHGHCVDLRFPVTSHMAGNHLHRIAGWGLAVFGGKPSSRAAHIRAMDVPFSRHLIHHNRVEDVLLKSNDWGGIETWQGGPFYVFNNLVINALGYKNWTFRPGDTKSAGSFGHAYYLDGSFKNYLFNNIAAGRNNTLGTKGVNITGLQNIFSFENWFFHNTFFKFAEVTRQQEPSSGRSRYLANIFDDATRYVFRHTNPKDDAPDPNAAHYTQGGTFDYPSLAYAGNVFHRISGRIGGFEETGFIYDTLEAFATALGKVRAQASATGTLTTSPPLRAPGQGDFRPSSGTAAGRGFRVFVPWGLSGVVGEWDFVRNSADPARVMDGHWTMTPAYGERNEYGKTPRHPLTGTGITAESFGPGPLNTWHPASAVTLDGKSQHFTLPQPADSDGNSPTVDIGTGNLLIEIVFQTSAAEGTLVRKMGPAGYVLDLDGGRPRFTIQDGSGARLTLTSPTAANTGQWVHLVAELDRKTGLALYQDGQPVGTSTGPLPPGSLANTADFLVGGGPEAAPLAGSLAWLRVARGTLADARTTIGELYAWQFNGPQFRDFADGARGPESAAGALAK